MSGSSPAASERYQTIVTILIALVSTAIALVASQAALAAGNTTESQHNGVLAKINQERVYGRARVELAQNHRAFDQYQFNYRLSALTTDYITTANQAGNTRYETRLREESAAEYEDSVIAFNLVDGNYLISDANDPTGYSGIDDQRFLDAARQRAAIYQDVDSTDNFSAADSFRTRALALNAGMIVLFVAVMFLTWAQITRSPLRWVWLAAGLLTALGLAGVSLVSTLIASMGG